MLGFPKATELYKPLPKKAIFEKFQLNTAAKEKINADISRITIVNEISPATIAIAAGERVKSFFVVLVLLKRKNFAEQTIATISKLIQQNMLFILELDKEAKLAIYHTKHTKLLQTTWQPKDASKDTFNLSLEGLTLDTVWDNLVVQVGKIQIKKGKTLDEQIEIDNRCMHFKQEIARLDKLARKEKQPRKKFELSEKIQSLKRKIENMQ